MKISDIFKKVVNESQAVLIRPREVDSNNNIQYDVKELFSGKKKGWTVLDGFTASAMLTVYNALEKKSQEKYDTVSLSKLLNFTWKHVGTRENPVPVGMKLIKKEYNAGFESGSNYTGTALDKENVRKANSAIVNTDDPKVYSYWRGYISGVVARKSHAGKAGVLSNPVKRRTFEALKYPKGSSERLGLNTDPITSEYMPSYKYVIVDNSGKSTPFSYRTKSEAENALRDKIKRGVLSNPAGSKRITRKEYYADGGTANSRLWRKMVSGRWQYYRKY